MLKMQKILKVNAISVMNTLAKKYGFKRSYLNKLFSNVKVQKSALRVFTPRKKPKKDTRTAAQKAKTRKYYNTYGPWERYSRLKINPSRVKQGVAYIKKHQRTFDKVEKSMVYLKSILLLL